MEEVKVWYLTDNEDGSKIYSFIKTMGIHISLIKQKSFKKVDVETGEINIFIIDLKEKELSDIMSLVRKEKKLQGCLKFVILYKKQLKSALNISMNLLHIEFLSRPLQKEEFALLLEKSIIVERYKEVMKYISKDAEERIEKFENLLDINRKDIFEVDKEKEAFLEILAHEKKLINEQKKLNRTITEYTIQRQKDLFDIKDRIRAEEMLSDLRRKEMMDAQNVIKAQESVIEFSSKELLDANKIIGATEQVQELSRAEALKLHNELASLREENKKLKEDIKKLKGQASSLKRNKG